LNENTVWMRPIQKEVLNKNSILEKFNIHPTNFALARALVGDKSDNIQGIGGLGLKTAAKRFPIFENSKNVTIPELMSYSRDRLQEKNIKAYHSVLENEDVIRTNYHMMQLYTPILSIRAKNLIHETLSTPDMSFSKTGITKLMMQDGFGETNFIDLFTHCKKISVDNK